MQKFRKNILYFDNHIVVVHKPTGVLSQKDKTGDPSIIEFVKAFVKEEFNKPGDVFIGSVHRLDRPAQGVMLLAKTSKALTRLNEQWKAGDVNKEYLAIVEGVPDKISGTLVHYLVKDSETNKVSAFTEPKKGSKKAVLHYSLIQKAGKNAMLRINLETGRPHQIRVQLATMGNPIIGDIKYGARDTMKDKSICLLSYKLSFMHPVKKAANSFYANYPAKSPVWSLFLEPSKS